MRCLIALCRDLRRQLDLSKQTEEELAKRNNVYQKTIKSLLTKLKEQGMQQEESGGVAAELNSMIADLESSLHLASLQVDDLQHQLQRSSTKLLERTSQMDVWSAQHDQVGSGVGCSRSTIHLRDAVQGRGSS